MHPECSAAGRVDEGTFVIRHEVQADTCGPQAHYVVPDGHVFLLSDNRDRGMDSRSWGSVPIEMLKGKVTKIWWSESRGEQQWSRIGQAVR